MAWCRLQSQCFVKRWKLSTPTFIHDSVFLATSLIFLCSPSISTLTLLREELQKERAFYYGQLVSTLCTQMFFCSSKACGTHFSASSVNITCCLSSETELHCSFLLVVEQEVGNPEPDSKTPCSYRSN